MSTLVLRKTKGTGVTRAECEANFTNLNNDKVERSGTITAGKLALWDTGKIKASTYSPTDLFICDNHVEGTTNKNLTNAEYAKLLTLKYTQICLINADGTFAWNPQNFTCEHTGTGTYRVTHNRGWFHMDMVWCNDTEGVAEQAFANNVYTDVHTYNFSSVAADKPFTIFFLYNTGVD